MDTHPGRFTADIDGDFVVFLIGMRINRPLRVRQWWPVAAAMPRKADTAAARIGASTSDEPAVAPY